MQYNPVCKPNQLICGKGQIAVVTGWTPAKSIARHLDPTDYAVVGQLYSPTRGISFLFRNLLANPHVHVLIAVNATKSDANAGAIQVLVDFFKNGFKRGTSDTGRECWVIASERIGYIDIEIEEAALSLLRDSVACWEATSIASAVENVKRQVATIASAIDFSEGTAMKPWAEPQMFPTVEIESTIFPGHRYGHRIEGETIAEAWVKLLHRIRTTGTLRPTGYDGQWQELIDLMVVVTSEPSDFYFPEPNFLPIDRPFLEEYIPQMLEDAPYQEGVKYTYGQRMRSWFGRDQIEQVITKLVNEIDAASAVISLWDSGCGNLFERPDGSSDHEHGGSPCLNHIWVRVIEGEISLTALLRSNDMFAAWPANAMGLRALQQHIRDKIARRSDYNLTMGPLVTLSQSAHLYDDTFENVDQLIVREYPGIVKVQNYSDPVGNFLIETVTGDRLLVSRTTPGSGEIVKRYIGMQPLVLIREICADAPAIEPAHIGYLGIELEKARACLNAGKIYTQDW